MRTSMLCAAAVMAALAAGIPAHAELGSAPTWPASSAGQATRLVQHVSTAAVPYTVNETTLSGGIVRRSTESEPVRELCLRSRDVVVAGARAAG